MAPSPRGEMTEGTEMPLKRRGQCLQAPECAQFAASGCGSFSQGCTTQEGSSGAIIHPRTGRSPWDDGEVSILM